MEVVLDGEEEEDVGEDALRLVRWRLVLDSMGGSEVKRLWGGSMASSFKVVELWCGGSVWVGGFMSRYNRGRVVNMVVVYYFSWFGREMTQ
jgi:hypothetical protein